MTAKAIFTHEEWEVLRDTPLSVGLAIIFCDYGYIGSVFETLSLASQLRDAEKNYPNNELLSSLFPNQLNQVSQEISKRKKNIRNPNDFVKTALLQVSLAIDIISKKALPSEVQEYKQFIYRCGENVAKASREGLLGTREKISQPEAQLLGEIRTTLNLTSLDLMSPLDLNEHISIGELLKFLFGADRWLNTLHGMFFVILFSLASYHIASFQIIKDLKLGPIIIGLLLGVIYANSLGQTLPMEWKPGINFCKKNILNLAIIFYGVKLTFQDLIQVGLGGFAACLFIVISTSMIAFTLGKYWFKLDDELSLLIAAGSSICGSAAVLATGSILKSKPYKNIIAVAIAFLFGTVGMFLLPLVYRLGMLPINEDVFGIFLGATLPSVGNVAAAGSAISDVVEKNAIIVKMMRVILLVPFLLILGIHHSKRHKASEYHDLTETGNRVIIPWFAILFVITIAVNSWLRPSPDIVNFINSADKFGLTMAMTALGIETSSKKIQGVGFKPIYLGFVVSIWVVVAGLLIVNVMSGV